MTIMQPLDLSELLVTTFFGNAELFIYGSIIVLFMIAGYFRMVGTGLLMITSLYIITIAGTDIGSSSQGLMLIIGIIISISLGIAISRLFK